MTRKKDTNRMDRKARRVLRFFQKDPNVRVERVKDLAVGQSQTIERATAEEKVAVIALWCVRHPIDEVIQRVYNHGLERSLGEMDGQFFEELEGKIDGLEREGLHRLAADLLKVAEVLAEMYLGRERAARYRERIGEKLADRIRDLPFLKQRGW